MMQGIFVGVPTVIICNPEAAKQVLANKEDKYSKPVNISYDCDRVFARGVAVVEGEEWHHQRMGTCICLFLSSSIRVLMLLHYKY